MLNELVFSSETPKAIQYNVLPDGTAEVWMRRDITEVPNTEGEGTHFEYKEVMFLTNESEEVIASNFDTWFDYGAKWKQEKPLSQTDIVAKLQDDYSNLKTEMSDLTDAVLELANIVTEGA